MDLSSLFGSRYKNNTPEAQSHRSTQQSKTSQFRYHICGSKACTCRIGKDEEKKKEGEEGRKEIEEGKGRRGGEEIEEGRKK